MSFAQDDYLTIGVISRRCFAWVVDLCLIGLLLALLWWVLALFGLLTLGFGFALMAMLTFVPFCYHMLSLLGAASATPGQRMVGLTVRRNDDLGPPTFPQAVVSTLVFYATLATSGFLLIVVLFTARRRALHDLISGLVVVRVRALESLTPSAGPWNMYHGSNAPL